MNAVNNNPVTSDDIKIAEQIFGPDIGTLKGKTTRWKPVPVVYDYIKIPKELFEAQQGVTLCIDGLKVNGLSFLTTISRNICYRMAQWVVKHQTAATVYWHTLAQVFCVYNAGGFCVTTIHCDNKFCPLLEPLSNEFNVKMNYANPLEHIPKAEQNNLVIKEQVRANYHHLPYKHLTRLMVKNWSPNAPRSSISFQGRTELPRISVLAWSSTNVTWIMLSIVNMRLVPMSKLMMSPSLLIPTPLAALIWATMHKVVTSSSTCLQTCWSLVAKITPLPITPITTIQVHELAEIEHS